MALAKSVTYKDVIIVIILKISEREYLPSVLSVYVAKY